MRSEPVVREIIVRLNELNQEANIILAGHESSMSRVVTLESSYSKLDGLSLRQDELFREALRALELGLFRAAHVLAWAGFADFLHEFLFGWYLDKLRARREKWKVFQVEDLRDYADFAVIEAGKEADAYGKTMMKSLHGLLNKRNECAHPSDFFPDLNESLGYISELLKRVAMLEGRKA